MENSPLKDFYLHEQEFYLQLKKLLLNQYSLMEPQFKMEVGYNNLNFRLFSSNNYDTYGNKFIVKVYIDLPQNEKDFLEAQGEVLTQMANKRQNLIEQGLQVCEYPLPVKTRSGQFITNFSFANKQWTVRLLTYLEGSILSNEKPYSRSLLDSAISEIAMLSKILKTVRHPLIAERKFEYYVENFLEKYYQPRKKLLSLDEQELTENFAPLISEKLSQIGHKVDRCFIHGDLSNFNMLTKGEDSLSGIFDFSDIGQFFWVGEIANFIYYYIINLGTSEEISKEIEYILEKFMRLSPMNVFQVEFAYWLIFTRCLMSITRSSYYYHLTPQNHYIIVHKPKGVRFLEKFKNFDHLTFVDNLKKSVKQKQLLSNSQEGSLLKLKIHSQQA